LSLLWNIQRYGILALNVFSLALSLSSCLGY